MDRYYALVRCSPSNNQEILERGIDFDGIRADMIALRQAAPTGVTYHIEIIRPVTRPFVTAYNNEVDNEG